jgi:hypothetical protein
MSGEARHGINLFTHDDGSVDIFLNKKNHLRPWGSVAKPWNGLDAGAVGLPKLDKVGNPLEDCGSYWGRPIKGVYNLQYEGSGTFNLQGGGNWLAVPTKQGSITMGKFQLDGVNPFIFTITSIDGSNPPTNIKIIPEAYPVDTTEVFVPEFLITCGYFDAFRMMDWGGVNNSKLKNWADRPVPTSLLTYPGKGVCYEYFVELANRLKKDLWLCVPHSANDEYVRSMAKLFFNGLTPGIKVYIEYSNEVWNQGFAQTREILSSLPPTSADEFTRLQQYVALRIKQAADIWKEFYKGERANDLRPVYVTQQGVQWYLEQALDFLEKTFGAGIVSKTLYGVGYADYVFFDEISILMPNPTQEKIFQELYNWVETNRASCLRAKEEVCDKYGLRLVCYEGGQHLVVREDSQRSAKLSAQRALDMGKVYDMLEENWDENGGELRCEYAGPIASWGNGQYGCWGLKESYNDKGPNPKWDAVMRAIAGNPLPPPPSAPRKPKRFTLKVDDNLVITVPITAKAQAQVDYDDGSSEITKTT